MHTQTDLLDIAKEQAGIPSDYALAKRLNVTRQSISNMRAGRRIMTDEMALDLADLARLPAGYVLACLNVERAKCTACRDAWISAAAVLERGCKGLKSQGKRAA